MKSKEYKEPKESVDKVCDQIAMTYGMSDSLLNSGLLSQISGLSTQDKQCLIRYISEEVEVEQLEEDEWDLQDTSNLEPYTLEELYARIDESHQQHGKAKPSGQSTHRTGLAALWKRYSGKAWAASH